MRVMLSWMSVSLMEPSTKSIVTWYWTFCNSNTCKTQLTLRNNVSWMLTLLIECVVLLVVLPIELKLKLFGLIRQVFIPVWWRCQSVFILSWWRWKFVPVGRHVSTSETNLSTRTSAVQPGILFFDIFLTVSFRLSDEL